LETYSWVSDGDYIVGGTLENLHSDEEFGHVGYIHNYSKVIHVQYPVMFFTEGLLEDWLSPNSKLVASNY
jgi:hypothetical protein